MKNEEKFNKRLGGWLRQLRLNRELSQKELGAVVGMHRNTMARYEAGNPMPLFAFLRICEKLAVSPAEVLKW